MDQKEILSRLKKLNSLIEDYLDKVDMDEAEEQPKKDDKKED